MSSIAILAPSPIKGSGGVARIYAYAKALNLVGHQCDVYVFDSGNRNVFELKKDASNFYSVDDIDIVGGIKLNKDYNLIIATRWDTAKIVRDMAGEKKAYFIQDFEACFNPVGDGTIFAENSYLYGLEAITYGRWLALKLHSEFGNMPNYCNFATDLTTFRVQQSMKGRIKNNPAICFIYQHDKPRRCPQLGIEALGIVKNLRPDVELYFVGSNESPQLWYDYTNMGMLTIEGLNALYNKCHVGLCLSSSNPSCNAFDMMAAGLPSVDLYRENNLFDIPSGGVLLAHQTPESIAEAILYLISNPEILLNMSDFGIDFMKSRSSINEVKEFISIVDNIIAEKISNFDVKKILQQRFSGQAVIAAAYSNTSVIQHIHSQLSNVLNFINGFTAINEKVKLSYKTYNFVTAVTRTTVCPGSARISFKLKLKLFIKKIIKIVI